MKPFDSATRWSLVPPAAWLASYGYQGAEAFLRAAKDGSEAAAWVQAVGSVVAILVAVAVPWRQRELDNRRLRLSERAAALVVASGTWTTVVLLESLADLTLGELEDGTKKWNAAIHLRQLLLAGHNLPTDEQLLVLVPELPSTAITLASIRSLHRTLEQTMSMPRELQPTQTLDQEAQLALVNADLIKKLRDEVQRARKSLDSFAP